MLFDTFNFLLFLPCVVLAFHILPTRLRNPFLLIASYAFYAFWDYRFCSLLLGSTAFAYYVGLRIEDAKTTEVRSRWLTAGILANVLLLVFFKYFNFFIESFRASSAMLGTQVNLTTLQVILPVGISFYTFQKISYVVDVARGVVPAARRPLEFALYVAFFPPLLAGPIERAAHLLPQFENPRKATLKDFAEGGSLMLVGLTKKVCVADVAADIANAIFSDPKASSAGTLWVGMYLFACQIYGDFSGYSDMARGMGRFFGVDLVANFKVPYSATSFKEFWARWHISLSQWLRDYIYIPLGGNRRGRIRTSLNLVLTMLLGGLWHGANWTFVVWGGVHGACLVVEKWFTDRFSSLASAGRVRVAVTVVQWFVVFHCVTLLWVVFRCTTFAQCIDYFVGLTRGGFSVERSHLAVLACSAALLFGLDFVHRFTASDTAFSRWRYWPRSFVHAAMVCLVIVLWPSKFAPFLYFQF